MKNINIKHNISLLDYTTIRVGGFSEYFVEPDNLSQFKEIINWAKSKNLQCRIIGAGSNLLIKDKLHKGLTVCTKKLKKFIINSNSGLLWAECGVMLPLIANLLAKKSCKGGEWLIGIPGTIGGAIFMNAGTGKDWISKHLVSVQVMDKKNLIIKNFKKKDLDFDYRFSSFQKNELIILSGIFAFEPKKSSKKILEVTKENFKRKIETQPYHLPSFGSVFKNPKNNYAGKLIEEVGLKGFSIGGAQVSRMHSNFITNTSNATSEDIYKLITLIQQKVLEKKEIFLYPEVRMIGY